MHPLAATLVLLWVAWVVVWLAAARGVKRVEWEEPFLSRLAHVGPLVLAALLLSHNGLLPEPLYRPVLRYPYWVHWTGVPILALGIALAFWARAHLGGNWSSHVTVKEGHTLIQSGPYRLIRHPIYTGLALGVLGTAIGIGQWRGVLALLLVLAGFTYKLRLEERRMGETFPDYAEYRRRSWALIPFLY